MIQANNIAFNSNGKKILHSLNLSFNKPELVVILGPNGAGKSTLLQLLAGLNTPTSGTLTYEGKDLSSWKINDLAKKRSYLHQQNNVFGSFTVEDIIEMGRYPYFDMKPSVQDLQLIEQIISEMELSPRRKQIYQTLSGGEQQRIQFARAILQLQEPEMNDLNQKILFLDEPLNNLDMHYQYSLMLQARNKIVQKGGIVIAVLHDINMAYQFSDRVLIIKEGNLVVDDHTEYALNPEVLESIFDINIKKMQLSENEVFFHTSPKCKKDSVIIPNKEELKNQII